MDECLLLQERKPVWKGYIFWLEILTVPTYNGSTYNFYTLQWCKSNTDSGETILWIRNFDRFPSYHDAGQWQQVSHVITRFNNGYTDNHLYQPNILLLTFSRASSKLHATAQTVLPIGFAFDGLAPLQVTCRVTEVFWAQLR